MMDVHRKILVDSLIVLLPVALFGGIFGGGAGAVAIAAGLLVCAVNLYLLGELLRLAVIAVEKGVPSAGLAVLVAGKTPMVLLAIVLLFRWLSAGWLLTGLLLGLGVACIRGLRSSPPA